jgi:hypothetical protein
MALASPAARQAYQALMALPEPVRRQVETMQMFDERTMVAQYLFKERMLFAAGVLRFETSKMAERNLKWMELRRKNKTDLQIAKKYKLRDPQTKGRKTVEKAINRTKEKAAEWFKKQAAAMKGLGWTAPPGMTM